MHFQYFGEDTTNPRTALMLLELKQVLRIDHDLDDQSLIRMLSTAINLAIGYTGSPQLLYGSEAAVVNIGERQEYSEDIGDWVSTEPHMTSPDIRHALYEGVRSMVERPGENPVEAMAPYLNRWRLWTF